MELFSVEKRGRKHLLEVPFLSATVLDSCFGAGPGIKKARQTLCKTLHPGIRVSVGGAGTVQLNTVATLDCVATAGVSKVRDAQHLAEVYNRAGMNKLVQTKKYNDALHLARKSLQEQVRAAGAAFSLANSAGLVYQCVAGLTLTEPVVRNVAIAMSGILNKVDAEMEQLKRLPGRVVRFDGPEALVVVYNGERKELRTASSSYLRALGLQERGSPFVLHELSWSPAIKTSIFVPALDLEEGAGIDAALEKELKAAEEPLPEPVEVAGAFR